MKQILKTSIILALLFKVIDYVFHYIWEYLGISQDKVAYALLEGEQSGISYFIGDIVAVFVITYLWLKYNKPLGSKYSLVVALLVQFRYLLAKLLPYSSVYLPVYTWTFVIAFVFLHYLSVYFALGVYEKLKNGI